MKKIALIEDDTDLYSLLKYNLEKEGFAMVGSQTGRGAIDLCLRERPDLILLDIMLPGMNGYEICRTLRGEDIWTPILMLTAKEGEYDEAEGFEFGADDYLRKPFSHMVLTARLRSLIRRGSSTPALMIAAGGLTLDPGTRHCTRGEERIELTPREFSVLDVLMRRAPDAVAKHEPIDEVWGPDFEGAPNLLEVYVGYLRRKLDKPFGPLAIAPVRGHG